MEKPILFNTEMVRAILAGRKTQTRRLIRPQPEGQLSYIWGGSHPGKWTYMSRSEARAWDVDESVIHEEEGKFWTPPCNADDLLYVRETWNYGYVDTDWKEGCPPEAWFNELDLDEKFMPFLHEISRFWYLADDDEPLYDLKWKPSIHMPKAAARIWLKVKRVRVERVKDITEEDAVAEGCQAQGIFETARDYFAALWNTTQGVAGKRVPENWASNPWVWVIDFERVEGKHNDD
jgi:hypothetical protein